jgi:hypothetical protein
MNEKRGLIRLVGILLLITLIAFGGYAIFQMGLVQGAASGELPATVEGIRAFGPSSRMGHWGWGFGFFGIFGLLFKMLFFFLIISFFFRMIFFGPRHFRRRWGKKGMMYGPGPSHPPGHWEWIAEEDEKSSSAEETEESKEPADS